jgi:hypothetical protein
MSLQVPQGIDNFNIEGTQGDYLFVLVGAAGKVSCSKKLAAGGKKGVATPVPVANIPRTICAHFNRELAGRLAALKQSQDKVNAKGGVSGRVLA